MKTGFRLCTESNSVGDFKMPRCPEMELPPLELYEQDANLVSLHDIDIIGEKKMTVKLISKKVKTSSAPVAKVKSELDVKVERLIELKVQLDAVKKAADEYEKLRKELSGIADTMGASDDQVTFDVENGAVAFSAKTSERKISDMPKVFSLLGQKNFLKLAKITMTDLDKYMTVGEQESCVKKDLTGARKISVIPKDGKAGSTQG